MFEVEHAFSLEFNEFCLLNNKTSLHFILGIAFIIFEKKLPNCFTVNPVKEIIKANQLSHFALKNRYILEEYIKLFYVKRRENSLTV